MDGLKVRDGHRADDDFSKATCCFVMTDGHLHFN